MSELSDREKARQERKKKFYKSITLQQIAEHRPDLIEAVKKQMESGAPDEDFSIVEIEDAKESFLAKLGSKGNTGAKENFLSKII